ncbi:MAG: phosphomannose isomerase [Paenibacillaceae bacterium]|jgi:mannose-6-phosphate isomerase|nr:phosphomannose isomerase [Paenibacillaceae bacterium]
MTLYPLLFTPVMKNNVWGGRALERYGYSLPDGPIGEGWMIGDHANGVTVVSDGPLQGRGLDELRETHGAELLGSKGMTSHNGRFPLLLKLLDCNDDLSVQVHPSDEYKGLPAGELGKTEMWYILDAKPGARIIYGLIPGVTREKLADAIAQGRVMDCLQQVSVKPGDSFYIPAGTVHALGAGVLVAEVQQNSDTVYRLYDYNRPGLDGKPRELHVEHSLNVINYGESKATRMTTDVRPGEWLTLAQSPYFVVEKGVVNGVWQLATSPDSFEMLVVCDGEGTLSWGGGESRPVKAGQCYLLPAVLGAYELGGRMTVLRSYLP